MERDDHSTGGVVGVFRTLDFAQNANPKMGVGDPRLGHVSARKQQFNFGHGTMNLGPNLILEPRDALHVGGPVHGAEVKDFFGRLIDAFVFSPFDVQSERHRRHPAFRILALVSHRFFKPLCILFGDGHNGVDFTHDSNFFVVQLALEQIEQPLLGPLAHSKGDLEPKLVLHIVRSEHEFGVAQTTNGRDVGRGEQRF